MLRHDDVAAYRHLFVRTADEVIADLEHFASLLSKWQQIQNLVSRETLTEVWARHFADSLQLLKQFHAQDRHLLDIGSGGGFPALPLAIALKGSGVSFTLVEPTSRKVSFLRTVARDLNLSVTVEGRRAEQIDSRETGDVDVITSRALASLPQLCSWMVPFWSASTRALLHKGREHGEEIKQAATQWHFDVISVPSDTDPSGVILDLRNLREKTVR